MSPSILRRAAAFGLVLALAAAGAASADTLVADGDAVTAGSQSSLYLGEVAPGEAVSVDVAFRLTCKGTSHVAAGSTIAVSVSDQVWPADGSAGVSGGAIEVPADWPAPGTACPEYGLPTTLGAAPASVVLTAPSTAGTGYEYTFLFTADPGTGVTNTIAFTASLDVVAPVGAPPADTTPPSLGGMPGDVTVTTAGPSAVVTWTDPTAADDTDPAPVVGCVPASGSAFPLGTTTVTCTATDASGNGAAATFDVTVVQLAGEWGRPLGSGVPALVVRGARTVPLKLTVLAGPEVQGPGEVAAPSLRLERLAACAADAAVVETLAGGTFRWDDEAWHLNLRTGSLGPACWRLVASVADAPVAAAVIRVAAPAPASRAAGGHRHR